MSIIDSHLSYEAQTAAHRLLAEVLADGYRAGLVPLRWTIAETTGKLSGLAVQEGENTSEQVRAALSRWVRVLGISQSYEARWPGGPMVVAYEIRRVGGRKITLEVRAELLDVTAGAAPGTAVATHDTPTNGER